MSNNQQHSTQILHDVLYNGDNVWARCTNVYTNYNSATRNDTVFNWHIDRVLTDMSTCDSCGLVGLVLRYWCVEIVHTSPRTDVHISCQTYISYNEVHPYTHTSHDVMNSSHTIHRLTQHTSTTNLNHGNSSYDWSIEINHTTSSNTNNRAITWAIKSISTHTNTQAIAQATMQASTWCINQGVWVN